MKFCQSTSYGLVSYGYERHYDPSILSVADLSATDYGIAAECSLSVCLCVCVFVCVNHENLLKFHSDFFEILQVDSLWPN